MGKFIDLTKQKFTRLTVIKRAEDHVQPNGRHRVQWLCKCDCGNEVIVDGDNLRTSHTKSCGCYNAESSSKRNKKYNTYDLSNDYGIGYTTKNEKFYFDLEDYDKIKDCYWRIAKDGYIETDVTNRETKKSKRLLMHRLILNPSSNMDVDHIGGRDTRNDNRKINLRVCTHQENIFNCGLSKNNTSGVTGVCWDKRYNKWLATITYNGKHIHLGYFDTFEDAVKTRKTAEEKYFGEYSYGYYSQSKEVI